MIRKRGLERSEVIDILPCMGQPALREAKRERFELHDCPVVVGELLARKYRVEHLIGVGGMGIVVAAWHAELEHRVAIKFLRQSFAAHPEAAERFRREARAGAKITSDHVVRVLDVATLEDGVPYMVMEYLEGENLERLLEKVGPLDTREVCSIVLQVCDALADAHSNAIIHRDLKPANIYLMRRPGRPPLVKVLDFGVSKSLALNTAPHLKLTQGTMLVGSPLYMSPEQLDFTREIDARSDVWGLGVLMFELLTKQMPFSGESLPQIVRAVMKAERPPLRQLAPNAAEEMERILSGCLAVDPTDRFESAEKLARALRPLAADDGWAERFLPHLTPTPAEAAAYGHSDWRSLTDDGATHAHDDGDEAGRDSQYDGPKSGVALKTGPRVRLRPPWVTTLAIALGAAIGGALFIELLRVGLHSTPAATLAQPQPPVEVAASLRPTPETETATKPAGPARSVEQPPSGLALSPAGSEGQHEAPAADLRGNPGGEPTEHQKPGTARAASETRPRVVHAASSTAANGTVTSNPAFPLQVTDFGGRH